MKIRTSMKNACMYANKIIRIGYCDLQFLLRQFEPDFYNCGIYGWNCDIYRFYHNGKLYVITTGYRNMRGESADWKTVQKYNKAAESIGAYHNPEYISDYETRKAKYRELLENFLDEIS